MPEHAIHANSQRVAVIGAGLAGTTCAAKLRACGYVVDGFDKGRGPGGRMATRRDPHDDQHVAFDHGAQYFTARSAAFRLHVSRWRLDGVVAPWRARVWQFGPKAAPKSIFEPTWYVGVPSMSAILRHDQQHLDIHYDTRIDNIERIDDSWHLRSTSGLMFGPYSHLVLALPAPQAATLLQSCHSPLVDALNRVRFDPCWAAMVRFDQPLDVPFDAATIEHGMMAWMARNSSKPQRAGPKRDDPERDDIETWVIHACTPWSIANLERDRHDVADDITNAFLNVVHADQQPVSCTAHRWRYARASQPLGRDCLFDVAAAVGVCGDWCIAGRMEAAYQSGMALAETILEPTAHPHHLCSTRIPEATS